MQVPPSVSAVPALLAKTSIIWNPIIYVARHNEFRRACFSKIPVFSRNRSIPTIRESGLSSDSRQGKLIPSLWRKVQILLNPYRLILWNWICPAWNSEGLTIVISECSGAIRPLSLTPGHTVQVCNGVWQCQIHCRYRYKIYMWLYLIGWAMLFCLVSKLLWGIVMH